MLTMRRTFAAVQLAKIERVIHEPVRLGIMTALKKHGELSFLDIKEMFGCTDGVISVHAYKLELAGYVNVRKVFEKRKPRTTYILTSKGATSLAAYFTEMRRFLNEAEKY